MCQISNARTCSTAVVEVEESVEPLVAFDGLVAVGRSKGPRGRHEQPVADALVVALTMVVLDVFRQRPAQMALTEGASLLRHSDLIDSTNRSATSSIGTA